MISTFLSRSIFYAEAQIHLAESSNRIIKTNDGVLEWQRKSRARTLRSRASSRGWTFPKIIFKASFDNKIRIIVLQLESLYYLLPYFGCAKMLSTLVLCTAHTRCNSFIELKLNLWINVSCGFAWFLCEQVRKLFYFTVRGSLEKCTCTTQDAVNFQCHRRLSINDTTAHKLIIFIDMPIEWREGEKWK